MSQRHTAIVLVIGVLALAGCSAGGGASTGAGDLAEVPSVAAPESLPVMPESLPADGTATSADRQVISDGTVTITAEDPMAAAGDAVRIVEASGGRIDSRNERPAIDEDDELASAELIVRIPSIALTATLDAIEELGELEEARLTQTDVTTQTEDIGARITALQTSTDRLTALLAAATTTKDLIEIESILSERQGELESLQAQQRGLADQVDLATVSIAFGSEATAPVESPDNFLSGLATGWESVVAFVDALLVAFGVALPWLVILGVIAAVALLLIRRRHQVTPATATTPATTTMEE